MRKDSLLTIPTSSQFSKGLNVGKEEAEGEDGDRDREMQRQQERWGQKKGRKERSRKEGEREEKDRKEKNREEEIREMRKRGQGEIKRRERMPQVILSLPVLLGK